MHLKVAKAPAWQAANGSHFAKLNICAAGKSLEQHVDQRGEGSNTSSES
ncbi:hypothetical protein PF005_g8862 [Phytophthora fragariae]|uniref:Uncharacterized protein n=1 Tax=Phytophthora fragariae TaxID=53985 RepID=A0A6A3UBN9_9STRA|nr:hypothetical protein PF003_g1529 [Phytophthora fragariae]KAE8939988.1 hypothetical protein PF009_g10182 [Phytophthora fragariae]KAE9014418.1 hypothetical protein PF011_g8055 [Phytophthora fragariae]KAE9119234.1 hypothetical protein PF007_g8632 [Phytophthora fragariae]KAE9140653.1 hypothetical protein PF010_g124 [Phytophthora fragariae]